MLQCCREDALGVSTGLHHSTILRPSQAPAFIQLTLVRAEAEVSGQARQPVDQEKQGA